MPGRFHGEDAALARAAGVALGECLQVRPGERVLVITNPGGEAATIAEALYDAALQGEARPVLLFQPARTQLDFADEAVYAAISSNPEVVISMSQEKLGKDRRGFRRPYRHRAKSFDSLFHYLLYGKKSLRAFWSPRVTREIFARTVPVDYGELRRRCRALKPILDQALEVHITSPGRSGAGTDLHLGLRRRRAYVDDGDFARPGSGGNLPAGEVFVSPELGTAHGRLVFDGSLAAADGVILIEEPVEVRVEGGFAVEVRGGREAARLRHSLEQGRERAAAMEREGTLAPGQGGLYARNACNLGELGIGLNPAAVIAGNVINDEKVYGTCHLAIGHNYDEDAPALIHLDGLVRRPTIRALLPGGRELLLMEQGELAAEAGGPG